MKIGIIGAGQMARALAAGFADDPLVEFSVFDPSAGAITEFDRVAPGRITARTSNAEVAQNSHITVLAVKPQSIESATGDLAKDHWPDDSIVVSVVAGVSISRLEALTGNPRIVRVMPNTPCLIGEGAMAMACNPGVNDQQTETIFRLLQSVGLVVKTTEDHLDAVTGLSGSGPAYVFTFVEALAAAGVDAGLPEQMSYELALQTVLGSAMLLKQTGESPAVLRDRVTSPGGTTIEGLNSLKQGDFGGTVKSAVAAATQRSKELDL